MAKTLKFAVLLFIPLILIGISCTPATPDADAPAEADITDLSDAELEAMDCQTLCNILETRLSELRRDKTKAILSKATGCHYGTPAEGTSPHTKGEMFSGNPYYCDNQSAAEALGRALEEDKKSDDKLDKEIDEIKDMIEEHCTNCMVLVHQCIVCAGTPPGGLCPTYFVTSKEECDEKGGEFQETVLPE